MASKKKLIKKINKIITEHGSFGVCDVEAESSPIVNSKGRLSHLMEDFNVDGGVVKVYDPSSHSSDEIDEYDEFYNVMDKSQLKYILDLAERWIELSEE